MAIIISKGIRQEGILKTIKEMTGVDVRTCLQCKKCTNGCPVTDFVKNPPSEIIRKIQLDMGNTILKSDLVWMCASCETCLTRCPMKIDMAAVMDALRVLAQQKGAPTQKGNVPLFNKAFLKTVEIFGRSYDIATIAAYRGGSFNLFQDVSKFPAMLKKKKIALIPSFKANKRNIKKIFNKVNKK